MTSNLDWNDSLQLQRIDKVQFSALDDESLGIDAQGGMCYSLNATANQVWTLLKEPLPFAALCQQLAQIYGVDENTVRADMPELLTDLHQAGLIRVVNESLANETR
jgi:hypothetical protein